MAGIPERPTNQPLTREAKDRIGPFYSSLVCKAPSEIQVAHSLVDALFSVRSLTGVKIPSKLTEQLGLENFSWVYKGWREGSPVVILMGKEITVHSFYLERNKIEDALATIEIAGKMEIVNGIKKRVPFYLRVAGIDKEQNRIVAATYDLEDQNRLTELNVSMPLNECPNYLTNDWDTGFNLRPQLVKPIPSQTDNSYDTAGLITKSMCEMVETIDPKGSPHKAALIFQLNPIDINRGLILRPEDKLRLNAQCDELGYYAKREKGMVIVGLETNAAKSRGINHWEISVPEFLQKA